MASSVIEQIVVTPTTGSAVTVAKPYVQGGTASQVGGDTFNGLGYDIERGFRTQMPFQIGDYDKLAGLVTILEAGVESDIAITYRGGNTGTLQSCAYTMTINFDSRFIGLHVGGSGATYSAGAPSTGFTNLGKPRSPAVIQCISQSQPDGEQKPCFSDLWLCLYEVDILGATEADVTGSGLDLAAADNKVAFQYRDGQYLGLDNCEVRYFINPGSNSANESRSIKLKIYASAAKLTGATGLLDEEPDEDHFNFATLDCIAFAYTQAGVLTDSVL